MRDPGRVTSDLECYVVDYPIFLSIVLVVRDQSKQIESLLVEIAEQVSPLVSDYELIVVDNASEDNSVAVLKELTGENGQPNLQVYALTKEVDADTAVWVGLENALGDFLAVFDPTTDDIGFLPDMLDEVVGGADVVFATNEQTASQSIAYRVADSGFNFLYRCFNGIHLARDAPHYRVLSKRVVNFVLRHAQPSVAYRYLPATAGFARVNLSYKAAPKACPHKHLGESVERGIRLLVSTTKAPMRLVTALSLFGAGANVLYSAYVIAVGLLKADVAAGWVSLSLQQSGMFFLISLVLLVLGEYILQLASLSGVGPLYYVGQEFTSARLTRREKLNIEESVAASSGEPTFRSEQSA